MISKTYLNSLDDKKSAEFADNFDKKLSAIKSIYGSQNVERGFGNYNSKIVLAFKDMNVYKNELPALEKVLNKFGIEIYNLYVMFYNNGLMEREVEVISPIIIYMFSVPNMSLNVRMINIENLDAHLSDGPYVFDRFKHLVTYNV